MTRHRCLPQAQCPAQGPNAVGPKGDPADGQVVEPGVVGTTAEAGKRLADQRQKEGGGQNEPHNTRLFLAIPRVCALLLLGEEEKVADAPTLLAGELGEASAVEMHDAGLNLRNIPETSADRLMHHVNIKEIGFPRHMTQQGAPKNKAVGADRGQGVLGQRQLEIPAHVLPVHIQTRPRAGDRALAVVVADEQAERIVHAQQRKIAGQGRITPPRGVFQRLGRHDVAVAKWLSHLLQPAGVRQDVVAIHQRDQLPRRRTDPGGLARLAGLQRIVDDPIRAQAFRNRDCAVRRTGVRDHDLVRLPRRPLGEN